MKLDRVTMTGADDFVSHHEMVRISNGWPFVEWGVLIGSRSGVPRYPSERWIWELRQTSQRHAMHLSLHVCGRYVRRLLMGEDTIPIWMTLAFDRIQLNFHGDAVDCEPALFIECLDRWAQRQIIFQFDGAHGNKIFHSTILASESVLDFVPLFDRSGGAGIVPTEWPAPLPYHARSQYYGYAGGLGPENLEHELGRIAQAAGDARVWVDMETRVRSRDDIEFDLAKVIKCLEIAKPFVDA